MEVWVNNLQDKIEFGPDREKMLTELIRSACAREGTLGATEVSVSLVDDAAIRELNRDYRHIDAATDVLSFPLREEGDPVSEDDTMAVPLGDIVISLERAAAQAEEYGHSLNREIGFLAIHGLLHLLGFDHESEAGEAAMTARAEENLAAYGLNR